MNKLLWKLYFYLLSVTYIPNWIINRKAKTILDLGCGKGLPMQLINVWHKVDSTGVDLFKPYINECKRKKTHTHYLVSDVLKVPFEKKSFDLVMASQVIEHLSPADAKRFINKIESMAKRQVIISTPIGKSKYGTDDGNKLQQHKSYFYPRDFQKRGYKIIRIGGKWLFSDEGLVKKVNNPALRKILIALNIFLTPVYLIFQNKADYYFWAYKDIN